MYIRLPKRIRDGCVKAIDLAKKSEQHLEKDGKLHPLVGAVVLDSEGDILAEGTRLGVGRTHAEVDAISNLNSRKALVHTVITTLEPCCYRGDPTEICCAKRIVRLGTRQVVIGTLDPARARADISYP